MRLIYLIYFILKADYKKVWQSICCQKEKYNSTKLLFEALWCSFYYGTSLNDYFNFRFFEKKHTERNDFASTLFMYKFHKALNQKEYADYVDNKEEFRKHYKTFAGPSNFFEVNTQVGKNQLIEWLNENNYKEIVIKDPVGTTGKSVLFLTYQGLSETFHLNGKTFSLDTFFKKYSIKGKIYIEPRLDQHPLIKEIAPNALNTIRVITVLKDDKEVDVVAAVFRISINGPIDNYSAGNIAAPVDPSTGVVIGPGRKKMGACSPLFFKHPITQKPIKGFQIPLWGKVLETTRKAALITPEVRTIGWDVAILTNEVKIIEGNSKWNKDTPQIPLSKGIKSILEKYL